MSKFSIGLLLSAIASFFTPENDAVRLEAEEYSLEEAADICLEDPFDLLFYDEGDTNKVKKNPNDRVGDATQQEYVTPLQLGNPANMKTTFELEDDLSGYSIYEKVGAVDFRRPSYIGLDDYIKYRREKEETDYFREQSQLASAESREGLQLNIDIDALSDVFGGGTVSIRPTGYATLDFGLDRNRTDNPNLPVRQQRTNTFNFDQQIQLGVIGQIGEKLRLNANFDTQATFAFDNELKLEHQGTEDQILQEIKAGNVSMQVGNSLIQGRQNLMGLQTRLKFGPVYVSAIASTERGKVESMTISGGGAIETPFEKEATEYDMNRHFFLTHYFRSRYEAALVNLPIIQSTLRINRVEIWVEQQGNTRNNRNSVGLIDLGEHTESVSQGQGRVFNENLTLSTDNQNRYPKNESNNLYELLTSDPSFRNQNSAKGAIEALPGLQMQNTADFQVLGNMRRLDPNEYTVNTQLGYVSLNSPIPTDQVLFVAFNYTLNGQVNQVGEFSDDVPPDGLNSNVLFTKMLKPSVLRVAPYPAWDLMMKNIYNIGYGLRADGFFLDIKYESGTSAGKINFLPTGAVSNRPLIQVTGVDNVTNNTAPGPDNYFDFIEGITVKSDRGLVIFPVLEPFGDHLATQLENDPDEVSKYVYSALYDDTQQGAVQRFPELNRFTMEGYYQSSGSGAEIPLNTFDLAEGSVSVSAGGRTLVEGVDFQVDYFGGKITILNQSILSSGQDITISFESSSLYNIQTKTLLGSRVEYSPSDNIQLGGTILNLREQPFNNKTILGDEPINNTLWGLDASIRKESDLMTKIIDKLPLVSTKETSNINAAGEFAQFIPGAPGVVKNERDKGIVFLDDFEAASTPYNQQGQLKWKLASFPEGNPRLFDPKLAYTDELAPNFTRAKLAWYQIDQAFYRRFGITIPDNDLENNYTRQIFQTELFPTSTPVFGNNLQPTFDLRYIPSQRGPYNYQYDQNKLEPSTGAFTQPQENWAGIMREIDINNDFEATNVEFLEFWMMDPFLTDSTGNNGGEFYINLGLVNEDVLPDESLSREYGLPGVGDPANITPTSWGNVSLGNPPTTTFSNSQEDRALQDVGFDGLASEDEAVFFQRITDELQQVLSPGAFQEYLKDPSSDDFIHFRDSLYEVVQEGVLQRYVNFNGLENNSPVDLNQANRNYTIQATNEPDAEDLNRNGSLNFAEQYWEYRMRLHPDSLEPGQNFIVDKLEDVVTVGNAQKRVRWYQFRIPLKSGRPVNDINNFKTISFMRMYMTGFEQETIVRMTELQLVASQWLRFTDNLAEPGVIINPIEPPFADFQIGNVSIEENSQKLPFNYVLPPEVERQRLNGNTLAGFLQDERSMTIKTCGLADGDARGIFKTTKNDLRQYDRLRMWVHAEAIEDAVLPSNFYDRGDAAIFLRVGLDNDQNYYEYEIPLTPSNPAGGGASQLNIWNPENEFDFPLALFAITKEDRNSAGTGLIYRHSYSDTTMPEGHKIYIKGTPKLSDVRNIMIGVRNPSDPSGDPICLEVWVNELRLTNFDKSKGWAANASASIQLADLGTINASGSYKTSGFGPLEQKLSNRQLEDVLRYDLSANLNLDKFLPSKWNISMPVYATFGEQKTTPIFNPQEADVRTDKLIDALPRAEAKEKLSEVQDYRRTRSISFNNWRKGQSTGGGGGGTGVGGGRGPGGRAGGGRPGPGRAGAGGGKGDGKGGGKLFTSYPWSISNFDFSFAYNEQLATNSVIERRFNVQHRAGINYRYQFPQVQIKPFIFLSENKLLGKVKFLTDMTINPFPNSVSIAVAGDRTFEERLMRATSLFGGKVDPLFSKNFLVNRSYNLAWNLTKNLQFTYSANNVARVDEVQGYWGTAEQRERDSIGTLRENLIHFGKDTARGHDQLVNFGRTTNFTHNFNVAYQLPFSQIKPLDWINGTVNYTGGFTWQQAPEIRPTLGATIGNTQGIQANGRVDLNGLYRKFKPLKKILDGNKAGAGRNTPQSKSRPKPKSKETPLPTEDAEADTTKKPNPFLEALKFAGKEVVRIALSVRSVDMTYSRNNNVMLPGYLPGTDNFGLDWAFVDTNTNRVSPIAPPTAAFVFGGQEDIRPTAAKYNWITRDTTLANLYMANTQENLTARTSVELFKGFRIDISANRSVSRNASEFFRWNPGPVPGTGAYESFDPLNNGTFSMSYVFINTAFEDIDAVNPSSAYFEQFSETRQIVSKRYAEANPQTQNTPQVTGGFSNGYLGTNQDVLITSLLANYGFLDADQVELSPFPALPLPNWNVNFNGLSNIPFFKEHFNAITLKHSYRGTYTVGNFNNNLNFQDLDGDGYADMPFAGTPDPTSGIQLLDYYAQDNIQAVQISEQFAPLIGFNLSMKNGLTGQIDYKRGRQLTLNVGSLQVVDMRNQDLAFMFGYRKDKLNWRFRLFGREIDLSNSANFQFQATMRDTKEINHTLSPTGTALDPVQPSQFTRGTFNLIISPSIDYVVNTRLNVKLFFERNVNRPYTSNAYNTAFTSGGVQIRFTLGT